MRDSTQSPLLLGELALREGLLTLLQVAATSISNPVFLAVTGSQSHRLSELPTGGPEGSSCVFPLFSTSFQTLQSNTGKKKTRKVFFFSLATPQRSPCQ